MADDNEVLHVDGKTFDTDDLTYAERLNMRRVIRNDLWDEDLDGPFDWEEVTNDHIMAATVLMFLRREDPECPVARALEFQPERVLAAPPTKASPKRSSSRAKASDTSGSQS